MELENTFGQVNTNIDSFQDFQIAATPLMYKLLSSDIYTDKIKAVIRELSTNAVDSMIEAGTIDTHKFQVTIPSVLSPVFKIRDFGTGLDEEGIKRVYTYGDSSRNKSNSFVGAFGIGSKSPFAYTKTGFDIVSWCNGKRYHYNASLIEGMPKIFKIDERESNEPNGVEVSITVDKHDCATFLDRAKNFYAWFDYKPDINIEIDEEQVKFPSGTHKIYETDKFILMSDYNSWNSLYITIKMGGILYEIPSIFRQLKHDYIDEYKRLIIKAPIGRYALQPSREQIDGTDDNKAKLKEDLNAYVDETMEQINVLLKSFFDNDELSYNQKAIKIRSQDGLNEIVNSGYSRSSGKFKEAFMKSMKELSPETFSAYERMQVMLSKEVFTLSTGNQITLNPMEIMVMEHYAQRSKKKRNLYGDKFLIRDVPHLKGQSDLSRTCNNNSIFSHSDVYDHTDPDKPVWLLKVKPEVIQEIKQIAMKEFGMSESQIVIASKWNAEWNEKHKVTKTSTKEAKTDTTIKCIMVDSHSCTPYMRDRNLTAFNSNTYVYYYDGRYTDVNTDHIADILDILYKRERVKNRTLVRTDMPIYCVHVKNKKRVEECGCINVVEEITKIVDTTVFKIIPDEYYVIKEKTHRILGNTKLVPYCKLAQACKEMLELVDEEKYETYCTIKKLLRYLKISEDKLKTTEVRSPLLDQWMIDYKPIMDYIKYRIETSGYINGYIDDFMKIELFIDKFGKDKVNDAFDNTLW